MLPLTDTSDCNVSVTVVQLWPSSEGAGAGGRAPPAAKEDPADQGH